VCVFFSYVCEERVRVRERKIKITLSAHFTLTPCACVLWWYRYRSTAELENMLREKKRIEMVNVLFV
jgi:hypothetical protein